MRHIIIYTVSLLVACAAFSSCDKGNDYLPPDWNYEIPSTPLKAQTQLGAFYQIYTTADWTSPSGYIPDLCLVYDEGVVTDTVSYTATQDGIITAQCALAAEAGIDFFIIPWNGGATETNFVNSYEFYWTEATTVKLVINYSFSHLHLTDLGASGADFDAVVADFEALHSSLFAKPYYYHMPDGRAIVIVSGMANEAIDWEAFLPAFRAAVSDTFYIIGENTTNWAPPVTNESTAKWLDANYVRRWYPTTYYERWACFYPFTDMAWQNWRDYASRWGNDFVPCIYPEYIYTDTKARYIERTEKNYTDFCNVAKRNIGSQNIILINSWNDFTYDCALEPADKYGKTYMGITKKELKK